MKLEGTYTFNAPRDIVWETLMDPDALGQAVPGGEKLEKVGENQYDAALNVRVGPVNGKFDGSIELSDINEPDSYHMSVSGQGNAGFLNGEGDVQLSDAEGGSTLMSYSGEAQVGGKIAGVGQRLIDSSAKSITRQGLQALDAIIQAKVAGKAGETVEVAAPSAVGMAATVAKDVTKDTVSDIMSNVSSNDRFANLMTEKMMPYTLSGGAIVLTLLIALIARLIGGAP